MDINSDGDPATDSGKGSETTEPLSKTETHVKPKRQQTASVWAGTEAISRHSGQFSLSILSE